MGSCSGQEWWPRAVGIHSGVGSWLCPSLVRKGFTSGVLQGLGFCKETKWLFIFLLDKPHRNKKIHIHTALAYYAGAAPWWISRCQVPCCPGKKQMINAQGKCTEFALLKVSCQYNQLLNKVTSAHTPLQGYLLLLRKDLILIPPVLQCCSSCWAFNSLAKGFSCWICCHGQPAELWPLCNSIDCSLARDLKNVSAWPFSVNRFCVPPKKPTSPAKLLAGRGNSSSPFLRN